MAANDIRDVISRGYLVLAASDGSQRGAVHWLRIHGIPIFLILLTAVVISRIGTLYVRRVRRRLEAAPDASAARDLKRTVTITNILTTTIRVIVWTLAILLILGELGVNLAPLIAGAGIAGVALGFGAQNMVRDFLAGFYVLFENQYAIGDVVDLTVLGGSIHGRVEELTLRSTSVRAADGLHYVVGNGNIQYVANLSRGQARIEIDVAVPEPDDADRVEQILTQVLTEARNDSQIGASFLAGPVVTGRQRGEEGVVIEIGAECNPARRASVEDALRRRISRRLEEEHGAASVDLPD